MLFFDPMPVWALAAAIFGLRIVDVSLGTVRTIAVVHGKVPISVLIGFVEVLVWVTAVSQVIVHLRENPALPLAYAGGFAAGNAVGILLERRIAWGTVVVRMIASAGAVAIAQRLRSMGYEVTAFAGEGKEGPRTLLFTTCPRRNLARVVREAAALDGKLFYTVDRFSQAAQLGALPHATGWRAVFKKK
jgi:uncharacterized protein YebE (UPF0316 family)